jgi:hypothetical protein
MSSSLLAAAGGRFQRQSYNRPPFAASDVSSEPNALRLLARALCGSRERDQPWLCSSPRASRRFASWCIADRSNVSQAQDVERAVPRGR